MSNQGGFHGNRRLFERPAPCLAQLSALLDEATRALSSDGLPIPRQALDGSADAWVNVSRHGHYNKLHDHVPAAVSGTYYVSIPEAVTSDDDASYNGRFAMRFDASDGACSFATVTPKAGMLILFDGSLKHAVLPLQSSSGGERISISFNCNASS